MVLLCSLIPGTDSCFQGLLPKGSVASIHRCSHSRWQRHTLRDIAFFLGKCWVRGKNKPLPPSCDISKSEDTAHAHESVLAGLVDGLHSVRVLDLPSRRPVGQEGLKQLKPKAASGPEGIPAGTLAWAWGSTDLCLYSLFYSGSQGCSRAWVCRRRPGSQLAGEKPESDNSGVTDNSHALGWGEKGGWLRGCWDNHSITRLLSICEPGKFYFFKKTK